MERLKIQNFAAIIILFGSISLTAQDIDKSQIKKFNQSAKFIVRPEVIAENPGRYTFTMGSKIANAWLRCGNFEPFSKRTKVHASGTSANEIILPEKLISGYDSKKNAWYDGAKVRVYRVINGKLTKIREDKIKKHVAEGWNEGVEGILKNKLVKPDVTTAQTAVARWSRHDCDYYYGVCAVSKNGELSAVSNYVKVFIPASLSKKRPKLLNDLRKYKPPRNIKKQTPPSPPSEFKAILDEKTGIISFSWEKSKSADIAGYRIVRSDYNPEQFRGYHLYLENTPTDPEKYIKETDLIFIDHESFTFNKDKELTNRVYNANKVAAPYFKPTKTENWKLVKHPGQVPEELQIDGGRTCIQIDMKTDKELALKKYNYASLEQHWYKVLDPQKTYIVEFWARQKGMTNPEARFSLSGALAREMKPLSYKLTEDWQKFTGEWSIKTLLKKGRGVGQMCLTFSGGPGTVWLDNWKVYEKGTPWMDYKEMDYKALRDSGMAAYRSHAHIKTRFGYSMEGFTNTAGGIEWKGLNPNSFNTLPNQLKIMKNSGTAPWLQIEMCMNEKEWLGFVEYFCAPYDLEKDTKESKPWAYKRYSQGHRKAYLDDFDRVLFELSNETWNRMFMPFGFSGVSMNDAKNGKKYSGGEAYGLFQEYVIAILRSSPYWTEEAEKKFEFVLGGWAAQDRKNGYGQSAGRMSPNSTHMTIAAYNGGWDEKAPPAKAAPKGYFDALTIAPRTHIPRAHKLNAIKKADGAKYALGTYEAGPGYNLNGLNGVKMTKEMVEQESRTMKSLAAGTATLDVFLAQSVLGYKLQNFFTFDRNRNYWTSHARAENGGQAYPSWKLLSLYNNQGQGDFLMVQNIKVPAWDFSARKRGRRKTVKNLPLVSVYATRNKDRLNLFVLSRKVKDYPIKGNQGYTPVTIDLPIKSAKKLTLYRMTGDPADHNLDNDKVKIEKIDLDPAMAKTQFVVNDTSGADSQGLPPASIFLYVFEACQSVKGDSEPILTSAAGQPDNASKGPVVFSILLPEADTVKKTDIKIGGSSGASYADSIKALAGSGGTVYEVSINSMLRSGTVSLDYKGKKAVVDFKIPIGESLVLASWYLPGKPKKRGQYSPTEKDLSATNFMPIIKKPIIVLGKAYVMSRNSYYNDFGLAAMSERATKDKDGPDRYLGWTIEPCNNAHISLDKLVIGLWNTDKKKPINCQLYYSLDGFKTSHKIDLKPERKVMGCGLAQGQGIPATADLSSIKALNNVSTAVEFRLHLWGKRPKGIGKLGQRRGDDFPDLEIKGRLVK